MVRKIFFTIFGSHFLTITGVNMPALSVIDGTPRDCPSPACGSEADTSILQPGQAAAMPLGKNSKGAVDAKVMVATFMGGATNITARELHELSTVYRRAAAADTGATSAGVKTPAGTKEQGVAAAAGKGATSGLPTTDDAGVMSMTIHQVISINSSILYGTRLTVTGKPGRCWTIRRHDRPNIWWN